VPASITHCTSCG